MIKLERKTNDSAKMKNRKEPVTPRRRASIGKNGIIGKVTRTLSRPVSSTAPKVTATSCNIKVVVRVRPPNVKEQDEKHQSVVQVVNQQVLIFDPKEDETPFFYHGVQQKHRDLLKRSKKDIKFSFDRVFTTESTNSEVFLDSTKNLIDNLMDGCNCSVFAYGATGAGKTFTMIGSNENPGITFLTMKALFQKKEDLCSERDFELMLTYIEVYNELVKDLLNPGSPLNLLEDAKYGVRVQGITGHKINKPDDLFSLLEQGNKRRTQHPTDANAESSRSHAVFQVYIQMKIKATKEVRQAKLSMIDLAGSERGSATGFMGARFKEGANINKSLLALGNCINSLADGQRHVPYRDSKLTRLLKDSLGGNCHTVMIANVSPSSLSFDDTYNTLKYASRASQIKTSIKRNVVNVDMHIEQYIKLVEDLQTENLKLKKEVAELKEMMNCSEKLTDSPVLKDLTNHQEVEKEEEKVEINDATTVLPAETVVAESPCNKEVDSEMLTVLKIFLQDQKDLLEREYRLQCSELGMSLKRELKTQAKDRLSNLYIDTPDKEEMRRKLNEQVGRFEKKEYTTKKELSDIQLKKKNVEGKIQFLLKKHPALKDEINRATIELEILSHKYKAELKQREAEVLLDDHKDKCVAIEYMAKFIKRLYLSVGGKYDAPESVTKDYDNLVATLNGRKNVKFEEVAGNFVASEGLNDVLSLESAIGDENSRKRKIETDSQISLDSTFTCNGEKAAPKSPMPAGGAKSRINSQLVTEGSKAPIKRFATGVSPRSRSKPRLKCSPKTNITNARLGRMDLVRNGIKKATAKTVTERPRFKF